MQACAKASDEPSMGSVRAFLTEARLSAYCDAFDAQGYDDLDFIKSLRDRPMLLNQLKVDVGLKPGHAAKFEDFLLKL